MKNILMAAVLVTSVFAGNAHAIIEGGCIPPKGPKKPPSTESAQRVEKKIGGSGQAVTAVRG